MIEYPIENRTKQTLWFDFKWGDCQRIYIYSDEGVDDDNADGYMPVDPGETIFIHLDVKQEGYRIEDKDGNQV